MVEHLAEFPFLSFDGPACPGVTKDAFAVAGRAADDDLGAWCVGHGGGYRWRCSQDEDPSDECVDATKIEIALMEIGGESPQRVLIEMMASW